MKPGERILFFKTIDGYNIHEWGTLIDTILVDGSTAYFVSYMHRNEKYGDTLRLTIVKPEEIEVIGG